MTESITPPNPTKDGVLPRFKIAADLPSPDTKRWVPRRKAVIVDAVRQGVVSLEEVCRRYQLSLEEFITWRRAIESHGVPGLRVTESRSTAIRDPAAMPAAAPVESPEDLTTRPKVAGTRSLSNVRPGKLTSSRLQTAQLLGRIEQRPASRRVGVRDHPVGRESSPGIGLGTEPRQARPVEMRFEDAVTMDGGPLRLPRPDPVYSLFGCATARCHE